MAQEVKVELLPVAQVYVRPLFADVAGQRLLGLEPQALGADKLEDPPAPVVPGQHPPVALQRALLADPRRRTVKLTVGFQIILQKGRLLVSAQIQLCFGKNTYFIAKSG